MENDVAGNIYHPVTGQVLFSRAELACKGTGMFKLGGGFAAKLLELRMAFDQPMRVMSCCRSESHNIAVSGHPRSLHVCDKPVHPTGGTVAIDIYTGDVLFACHLVGLALKMGWSVGVGKSFVHLDRRDFVGLGQAVFGYN